MAWFQGPKSEVLSRALRENRRLMAIVAVFSALLNLLYIAPSIYMMQVYDRAIPSSGRMTLVLLTAVRVAAFIVLSLLEWIRSRLLVDISTRLEQRLSGRVLEAALSQGGASTLERTSAMREFDTFRQSLAGPALLAALDAPWTPIYLVFAFLLHPALGGLGLASAMIMIALAWGNERATAGPLQEANRLAAAAYAEEDYTARSADTVGALGMRRSLVARQLGRRRQMIALQNRASLRAGSFANLVKALRLSLQSLILGLAAWLAIERQISPGAIFAASFLLARMLAPIEQVVGAWRSIVLNRRAYRILANVLSGPARRASPMAFSRPQGVLKVEGVSFAPPGGARATLQDISFAVEPGSLLGIIGASGAGKTTLVRLLAGAVEPSQGVIRLDGASYADWGSDQLANHVGYVPQDFVLFSGTIRENISRFRAHLGADRSEIDAMTIAAARGAGAHELILNLAEGYNTVVGLGGVGLSAGQAQRIALARALFGEPRLLVLDEPNAHLDPVGEAKLHESLAQLKVAGCAIVVVAHRAGVLALADRLLTLEDGRIGLFGDVNNVAEALRTGRPAAERVILERLRA